MLSRRLSEIMIARVPGVRARRSARGPAMYLYTVRSPPKPCYSDVYLDGVSVYLSGMESKIGEAAKFDINSIDPAHVSAIEFYDGPAPNTAQYNRTGSACGALLRWTR